MKYRNNLFTCCIILNIMLLYPLYAGQRIVHLSAPHYRIIRHLENTALEIDGYGNFGEAGMPQLPGKIISVPLPAGSNQIGVTVSSVSFSVIDGHHVIRPISLMLPSSSDPAIIDDLIINYNNNQKIYQQNNYYPESAVEWIGVFYQDQIPVVQIRFSPFRYHPKNMILEKVDYSMIVINYQDALPAPLKNAEQKDLKPLSFSIVEAKPFIIIGPEGIQAVIEPFIFWKTCLGYEVAFYSVESIYAENAGNGSPEQIRAFLQKKYAEDGIEDVLLIGHRDKVPYQKLYPNPSNHTPSGGIPTDMYYSQLSGNWDGDGDGFPGEFGEDAIDLIPELNVGRIPFSESEIIEQILNKIILFERDAGSWKNNALLMGAISNFKNENNAFQYYVKTDGAVLMEKLKDNVFSGSLVQTLYEKEGTGASLYACDYSLTRENVFSVWGQGPFGCLSWFSHGSYDAMKRKWWSQDNGDEIPENSEIEWQNIITINDMVINEHYQPIIFANACDNGWPERTSLARQLIRNGASAIISASRDAYATLGWTNIQDGGTATLSYTFWDYMIQDKKPVGQALDAAKMDYYSMFQSAWSHLSNIYAFNLFGDPTMTLNGSVPVYGGCQIHVSADVEISSCNLTLLDDAGNTIRQFIGSESSTSVASLPPGYYQIKAEAEGVLGTSMDVLIEAGQMNRVELNMVSPEPPKLEISRQTLDVVANEGEKKTVSINIKNHGQQNLTGVFAVFSAAWASILDNNFDLYPDDSKTIQIDINASGVQSGVYESQIALSSNDPQHAEMLIPLTLTVVDQISPNPIVDLQLNQMDCGFCKLSWTCSGDNGSEGRADHLVFISNELITDNSRLSDQAKLLSSFSAAEPRSVKSCQFNVDDPYIPYWFCIEVRDEAGNRSYSNVVKRAPDAVPVPRIQVSDSSFQIIATEQTSLVRSLILYNTGEALLAFHLQQAESQAWLQMNKHSGNIEPGKCDTVILLFSAATFKQSTFQTILTLSANTSEDSVRFIPVHMLVYDTIEPSGIDDLACTETGSDIEISWHATGDNALYGYASVYRIWIQPYGQEPAILFEMDGSKYQAGEMIRLNWPLSQFSGNVSFQVEAVDDAGHSIKSNEVTKSLLSGLSFNELMPKSFLFPNRPNPFNMETNISFSLIKSGNVCIDIFDARGRLICRLLDEQKAAGLHTVYWRGVDDFSQPVTSGLYFIKAEGPELHATRKIVLMK